jgi:ubiquinone/menaquinone biosynthesis C-methylase UbiE
MEYSAMTDPQKEHASTYFVQDSSNPDEMARLSIQDQLLTTGMGGVLPEIDDPTCLRHVLDVGCGTGGWLRETARQYPLIEELVGVDISAQMVAHANAQAKKQTLDHQVKFLTMDALRLLEFPAARFDLVNQRFGMSWLQTRDWPKLLSEYKRVCRPGGIIRITEPNIVAEYQNGPALTQLNRLALEAGYRSGRFFTNATDGVTSALAEVISHAGIEEVQLRVYTLTYQAGDVAGLQGLYDDLSRFYKVGLPYFQKWTQVPDNYDDLVQQALNEIRQPDFVVTSMVLTAYGRNPHP